MYNEKYKNIARELLIKASVDALIRNRKSSFIVTEDNLTSIIEHFKELLLLYIAPKDENLRILLKKNLVSELKNWIDFYYNQCTNKKASALKVLYLAGPDPENDIKVFIESGLSIHNIWAIESDKETFETALGNLIKNGLHIKLHRGSLLEFFQKVNHEFDIIYFDACSPIVSPNRNPLDTLRQIFISKRLSNLSALITNFSEPRQNYNWGEILTPWFATRTDSECPQIDFSSGLEDDYKVISHDKYSAYINNHLDEYYDKFVTHFIPCLASEMIPFMQMISLPSIQSNYFWQESKLNTLMEEIKNNAPDNKDLLHFLTTISHFELALTNYPLLNWARLSKEYLPKNHAIIRFLENKDEKVSFEMALYIGSFLKSYEDAYSGFRTFTRDFCNSKFLDILDKLDFFDRKLRITCDTPMKNLIIELIFGLYSSISIANSQRLESFKYKSKETWMYSNIFVFDQCRYLYDYIPSIDLFESYFNDKTKQIIIRGMIDCIRRNHYIVNNNLFKWGFIEAIGGKFGLITLKERLNLNEKY